MLNSPAPALGDVFTKEDIRVTRFARDLHSRLTMGSVDIVFAGALVMF